MSAERSVLLALALASSFVACTSWVALGDLPADGGRGDATADPPEGGSTNDASKDGSNDATRPYDPCAGKACGATCSVCPPSDSTCNETADLKTCDAVGLCRSGGVACTDASTPPYDPCEGKTCGSSCTQCPPTDPTCVETAVLKACNKERKCQAGLPDC